MKDLRFQVRGLASTVWVERRTGRTQGAQEGLAAANATVRDQGLVLGMRDHGFGCKVWG